MIANIILTNVFKVLVNKINLSTKQDKGRAMFLVCQKWGEKGVQGKQLTRTI
ncbi:hypothetical protein [uncultured Phascolarctobacterium sp.]|uniref:hypothetical protein n=1 Tax=uncultured Phascolarctobacterium sp. TaxID=512296 RepID=UPI0025FFA1D4|nr:hypothetical protein [uncultured Phascolarctobacterium sp.]